MLNTRFSIVQQLKPAIAALFRLKILLFKLIFPAVLSHRLQKEIIFNRSDVTDRSKERKRERDKKREKERKRNR